MSWMVSTAPNHINLPATEKIEGFGDKTISLTPELSSLLEQAARELRSTPSALLQAVWAILVGRLCGEEDIVFGNVVSGRPAELAEVENMVGMFINTVPVRMRTGNRSLRDIVRELTDLQGEREEHEYAALHQVQAQTSVPRGNPLFETLFVYENYPVDERLKEESDRNFVITDVRGSEAPHYPLSLAVLPGDHYTLQLTFDRERYDLRGAQTLLQGFETLLRSGLEKTDTPVSEIPLLDAAELDTVVHRFNATGVDFPRDKTLHRLFEEQAQKMPERIALHCGNQLLTCRELNARANRIAHALIDKGRRPRESGWHLPGAQC